MGACEVDLYDEKQVVQHIRDLLNLTDLLENGFDHELLLLIRKLKNVGWGDKQIHQMITYAGMGSRFERMTDNDGNRLIPRAIPESGSQTEWRQLKKRS
jgi:hypothetical protein